MLWTLIAVLSTAPVGGDPLPRAVSAYFTGEKDQGWAWLGVGAGALGAGTFLVTREQDALRGAAWPVLAVGALQTVAGIVLLTRSDGQIADAHEEIVQNRAGFLDAERARVRRVRSTFRVLEWVEGALFVGGLAAGFVGRAYERDTLSGVGFGTAAQGLAMFALDLPADLRAGRYLDALNAAPVELPPPLLGFRF